MILQKIPIHSMLLALEMYAEKFHVSILQKTERAIFIDILDKTRPEKILELGTAIGYSTLLMAKETKADIFTVELIPKRIFLAEKVFRLSPYQRRIHLLKGDAKEVLNSASFLEGDFDFVFMDAAKGQYPIYWQLLQRRLAKRAVVVADNVFFRGFVEDDIFVPRRFRTIAKRLNEYKKVIEEDKGFVTKFFHVGDGLAVSWKG